MGCVVAGAEMKKKKKKSGQQQQKVGFVPYEKKTRRGLL